MSHDVPSNENLIERLTDVDADEDVEVSEWEANFIQSIFDRWSGGDHTLTMPQRDKIIEILERYE